jgi:hypothetical protein
MIGLILNWVVVAVVGAVGVWLECGDSREISSP